jgi:hypothetical protein
MFDKNIIIISVLVLFIILWNYNTQTIEGFKFKDIDKTVNKSVKYINKLTKSKKKSNNNDNKESKAKTAAAVTAAAAAAATTAAAATAASAPEPSASAPEPSVVPETISQAAIQTPDFKDIQGYLEKLKTYSSDAKKMTEDIEKITADYSTAYTDATNNFTKLTEIVNTKADRVEATASKIEEIANNLKNSAQIQENNNNIFKKEIDEKINTLRDIEKNVSDKSIEVNSNTMIAKKAAEEARNSLAGILPTAANNAVLNSANIEGFTGFKSSILEGYTEFSTPKTTAASQTVPGYTNKNAFDLENALVTAINEFNIAYYDCLSLSSSNTITCSDLTDKRDALDDAIKNLSDYINNNIDANSNANKGISESTFKTNHAALKTKANDINNLRAELDMKMQEILKAKEGAPTDYTLERDTAAYSTILWSALATSLLYVIFVKLE